MAYNLNSCFKIPFDTIVDIMYIFSTRLSMPPSELDRLQAFWVFYLLDKEKEHVEAENERTKKDNEKYQSQLNSIQSNMPDYTKMASQMSNANNINNMSNMPAVPKIQVPSMPSFPT